MNSILRYKKIKRRNKTKSNCNENNIGIENKDIIIQHSETVGPLILRNILSSKKKLLFSILSFRIINSLINHTSYVPDEYWQSVEVAHKWIFQNGYFTWEWLPEFAIRSPLYPLLFAIPFRILHIFGLDNRILLIKLPMLIHGCLAALGDYHLYMFSFRLAGQQVAQWTLFNQLVNWFTLYSCTRTLINNIEWLLVILALHEYKSIVTDIHRPLSRRFILFVSLCLILRPTGAIVLLPICIYHVISQIFQQAHNSWSIISQTFINCSTVGTFTLLISLLIDKHFYGRWTCSQWNFLHFNLLTDISQTYGVHPWHWYISNAIPSMFLTQLPILMYSFWSEWKNSDSKRMISLILLVLYAYSCLGHKEFRFIFPIMPIAMHLIGCAFVRFPSKRNVTIFLLLISQIPMSFYMSLIHQRGANDIIMTIGRRIEQQELNADNISAVFLMPCHSTPWMSHIHHNISARFLTCDPQITGSINILNNPTQQSIKLKQYDEADLFYDNPKKWLLDEYFNLSSRPLMWIMFEKLSPEIHELLVDWNYRICKRVFHAHFPTHRHHSTKIVVYCLSQNDFL